MTDKETVAKRMTVVNLFGGPGSGKSTMAMGLSYRLKCLKVNVEYASEYAKNLTYSKRFNELDDQIYVFSKQQAAVRKLARDCDLVVADSPVIMGLVYSHNYPEFFKQTVAWQFNQYENINFFVSRAHEYVPIGRNQTEDEAKGKDTEIRNLLSEYNLPFYEVEGSEAGLEKAFLIIRERLSL